MAIPEARSNSTRRQADFGVEAISARSFLDRRRSVMNGIPIGDHDLYRLAVAHCRTTERALVRADYSLSLA